MGVHVKNEAERCLQCKKPLCRKGCPINTNIPEMIALFKKSKIGTAGKMLFDNNPLSIVCSLVCDHEKQCEGHCILGRKGNPVHISSIENYISNAVLDTLELNNTESKGKMVAIIGSGPAGICISFFLSKMGYDVTMFESKDQIGGVMRYGIPEFRLPKSILKRIEHKLREAGVSIRPNTTIGSSITIEDMLRDGYESIFIGTGVWRPKRLNIQGESLGNVHYAIDYLANPNVYDFKGSNVVIIGMGNSGVDVARTIIRKGAKNVTMVSRSMNFTASNSELEYAEIDGADLRFGWIIQRVTKEGPIFKKGVFDEKGEKIGEEDEEFLFEADATIISISQGPMSRLTSTTQNLKVNEKGLLITDALGMTTRDGVFAAGDVVLGAKTVVEAAAYSKEIANHMHDYMVNK